MEIIDTRKTITLKELNRGDTFTLKPLSRTVYMLIQPVDKSYFTNGNLLSVELLTGKTIFIPTNTVIYMSKVKLSIIE